MKTPQERGIIADCLFGKNYIKEGRLYLSRQAELPNSIFVDIMGELGRGDCQNVELFTQRAAELIGLKPLKAKKVCLDLVQALNNLEIENLDYKIPSEKPLKDRLEKARDLPSCGIINLLYTGLTCTIHSSEDEDLFAIGFPEEWASEELVVSPKTRTLQRLPLKDILEAYERNLSPLTKTETDYLNSYEGFQNQRRTSP